MTLDFDKDRNHNPLLHCPPDYAREIAHATTPMVNARVSVGTWLRHEWRPMAVEGFELFMACIHCRLRAETRT